MTNSEDSPRSNHARGWGEPALVLAALCVVVTLAAVWFFRHDYILYYGDAQSHLNLSRSIIDSRTPGYDQLGTVWLPVLHVLCLPLVGNDWLWSTGLAGAIPVALCFVVAGMGFYLVARDVYESSIAAVVAVSCLALNPNVLYLASIPMTEVVFLAGLAVLMFAIFRFRRTQNRALILLGIVASCSMSLTRYDGWFLIPFAGVYFAWFARDHRWTVLIAFGLLASLAPLYWMAHNWWETSNALDFYNGPYSASAIQGDRPYPGYHDWKLAAGYYGKAGQLCSGWCLILIGAAGVVCGAVKKALAPIAFLFLTPVFYIWSIHSSKTPIHLPQLASQGYYNSRYGIAVVVLAAFAAGAIVRVVSPRWKKFALVLPLFSVAPWILHPSQENWICWKESEVNSVSRRAWTQAGADFLAANYRPRQGILTPSASGDVAGIFCRARIPLRETLNVGNGPAWLATTSRPDLVHQEAWGIAQAGDFLSIALKRRPAYRMNIEVSIKDAPTLEIYERSAAK
ncbi:MAG: glycosyltransferase family 39 protein [Bryobacteraceae bacterium]